MRLLSAGQEVYVCDYFQHMVDHMQQMEKRDFGSCYLGFEANASDAARTVILPLLLPNSPYLLRGPHGEKDLRGHGVWPAYLGQNRLEIQLTMNTGDFPMADTSAAVPSISGKCSIMYRECTMTPANLLCFRRCSRKIFRYQPTIHRTYEWLAATGFRYGGILEHQPAQRGGYRGPDYRRCRRVK